MYLSQKKAWNHSKKITKERESVPDSLYFPNHWGMDGIGRDPRRIDAAECNVTAYSHNPHRTVS